MTADRFLPAAAPGTVIPPTTVVWELTAPVESPGGPGTLDDRLSTSDCFDLVDDLARCGVDTVVLGGEPTGHADFWSIVDHARRWGMGLAFDTDGTGVTPAVGRRIAGDHRLTARIRLAAATAATNDALRGPGAFRASVRAMELLASSGDYEFEIVVPLTRQNADHPDALLAIAGLFGARLRLTGDRPADLAPDGGQRRALADWLRANHGEIRLGPHPTGDLAEDCGAGLDTCRIDPAGLVYACPVLRSAPSVGSVRDHGGFGQLWRRSPVLDRARTIGCPAAPAIARSA
ncbi:hypothetical protein AB0I35_16345 [Nocardia sp. NPDC050378]|uniref:hypothetical protein n=1 Tax=Nocardia sp. NPDC050378 TaxID=3155400 RepID=UPI0033EFA4EF